MIIVKILLFPIFLGLCFIRTWAELLAKIGCAILGLFYLLMLVIIISYIVRAAWSGVALAIGISFVGFIITFAIAAVGVALEGITDKISDIMAS